MLKRNRPRTHILKKGVLNEQKQEKANKCEEKRRSTTPCRRRGKGERSKKPKTKPQNRAKVGTEEERG